MGDLIWIVPTAIFGLTLIFIACRTRFTEKDVHKDID